MPSRRHYFLVAIIIKYFRPSPLLFFNLMELSPESFPRRCLLSPHALI
jgi:hypothetical protein